MSRKLIEILPLIYKNFLPDFFNNEAPEENLVNCSNCTMIKECSSEKENKRPKFNSITKCCTYFPTLPNYLLGGLFYDENPELEFGKLKVKNKIEKKTGVNPLSLSRDPVYALLYANSKDAFGKSVRMMCPYFNSEKGMCSIWTYRNAICLTWFCKHNGSDTGKKFWDNLMAYLEYAEEQLQDYAVRELSMEPIKESSIIDERALDNLPPLDADYSAKWGKWKENEIELYKKAFDIISSLNQSKFIKIMGERGNELLNKLEESYEAYLLIPDYLKSNPVKLKPGKQQNSYLINDKESGVSFELPALIFELFDGNSSTEAVKNKLLSKHKLFLKNEVLRFLFHYDFLENCNIKN